MSLSEEQSRRIDEVAEELFRAELDYLIGYMVYQKSSARWMVDPESMEISYAAGYVSARLDFRVPISDIGARISPIMMKLAGELAESRSK